MGPILLKLLVVMHCCFAVIPIAAQEKALPQIKIDVKLDRSPNAMAWSVRWQATGIEASADSLELRLADWGEWDRAPARFFSDLKCNVELKDVKGDSTRKRIVVPEDWDGAFEVRYMVKMMAKDSEAREHFGLMPWCSDSYGQGFTSNTLMDLFQKDKAVDAARQITFTASKDDTIVSGWGPLSKGSHSVQLSHPIDNTVVLFGTPNKIVTGSVDDCDIEVVQFGSGTPIAEKTKSAIESLVKSCGRATGLPLNHPVKIFLTDTHGGGTNVDGAMVVGYPPGFDEPDDYQQFAQLLLTAHELFHEWLGAGFVRVHRESVWFQEGFTDYFALWHLAHLELITKERFIERIEELATQLTTESALGKVAFGDSSVDWRDSDGPVETMAYKGGAVLAFLTDVELRKQGKPGLSRMLTDLVQLERPVRNEDIKNWYYQNGLEEFHKKWIEKPDFPLLHGKGYPIESLAFALESIGYELDRVPTTIPYLGFSVRGDGQFGIVSELAPDGPAKKAGLQIGDQIVGYWLAAPRKVELDQKLAPKHVYGFDQFQLGETIHFDLFRENKELQLDIEPTQLKGVATELRGSIKDKTKFDSFFQYELVTQQQETDPKAIGPTATHPSSFASVAEMKQQHQDDLAAFMKEYSALETELEKGKLVAEKLPKTTNYAHQVFDLVERDPTSVEAAEGLLWVMYYDKQKALILLLRHHLDWDGMGDVALEIRNESTPSPLTEYTIAEIANYSPHRSVRGTATYSMLEYLERLDAMLDWDDIVERVEKKSGSEGVAYLERQDRDEVRKRIARLEDAIKKHFADVPHFDGSTLGEVVERKEFERERLQVGKTAPEIVGKDLAGEAFKLSDYRGKIVVLHFWGHW